MPLVNQIQKSAVEPSKQFIVDENEVLTFLCNAFEPYRKHDEALFFFSGHHLASKARFCGISYPGDCTREETENFTQEVQRVWRTEPEESTCHQRILRVCQKLLATRKPEDQVRLIEAIVPCYLSESYFDLNGTHLQTLFESSSKDAIDAPRTWPVIICSNYSNSVSAVTGANAPTFVAEYLYYIKQTSRHTRFLSNPIFRRPTVAPTLHFLPVAALGQTRAAACWMALEDRSKPHLQYARDWANNLYTSLVFDLFVVQLATALSIPPVGKSSSAPNHSESVCEAFAYLWRSDEVLLVSANDQQETVGFYDKDSQTLAFRSDNEALSRSKLSAWHAGHRIRSGTKCIRVNPSGDGTIITFRFRALSAEGLANRADVDVVHFLCNDAVVPITDPIVENLLRKKLDIFVARELENNEVDRQTLAAAIAHEVKNTSNPILQLAIKLSDDLYENQPAGPDSSLYRDADELQRRVRFLSASTLALDVGLKRKYANLRPIEDTEQCKEVVRCALSLANAIVSDEDHIWTPALMDPRDAAKRLALLLKLDRDNATVSLDDVLSDHLAVLHIIPFVEPIRNMHVHAPTPDAKVHVFWSSQESEEGLPALILKQVQEERNFLTEDWFTSRSLTRLYGLLENSLGFKTSKVDYRCEKVSDKRYLITHSMRIRIGRFLSN